MVRNAYQGIGTEYETLLRAFDKENVAFAKRVGKDIAKNTYNKYLVVRNYVAPAFVIGTPKFQDW